VGFADRRGVEDVDSGKVEPDRIPNVADHHSVLR
jgi:hypothetical protein